LISTREGEIEGEKRKSWRDWRKEGRAGLKKLRDSSALISLNKRKKKKAGRVKGGS